MQTLVHAAARLALVATMLASACGGATAPADLSVIDFAAAPADMAMSRADMVEPLACRPLLFCLQLCKGESMCQSACQARATPAAAMMFQALADCTMVVCQSPAAPTDGGTNDGGVAPCGGGMDGSPGCLSCLAGAAQSKACTAQFGACFGDT